MNDSPPVQNGHHEKQQNFCVASAHVCKTSGLALNCYLGNACVYYLNFFQDITEYQGTIANIFKDFSKDLESVELFRVTDTYFLELLEEKRTTLLQADFIFLSD